MTCSRCGKRTDGQPIIAVYASVDGARPSNADRFTGVVWCADCIPSGRDGDQMRDDLAALTR